MKKISRTALEVFALRRNGYSGPFFVGFTLFLMGGWLVAPWDTFSTSNLYSFMDEVAIEEAWGFVMMASSSFMVISAFRRRPRDVALGSLVAAMTWFLVMASFIAGNPSSITVPIGLVMTLRCMSIHREYIQDFDEVTGERLKRE